MTPESSTCVKWRRILFENHSKSLIFYNICQLRSLRYSNFPALCFCFDLPKFTQSTADIYQKSKHARNVVKWAKCDFCGDFQTLCGGEIEGRTAASLTYSLIFLRFPLMSSLLLMFLCLILKPWKNYVRWFDNAQNKNWICSPPKADTWLDGTSSPSPLLQRLSLS